MSFKQVLMVLTIAVVAIVMSACGSTLNGNPKVDDNVYGNGGMQVRKGDYVYFMNGFYGLSDIDSSSNKYGSVVRGAICRVQLKDGALPLDSDGNVTDVNVIVPKITCYEFGGFYIFDDYIYYATPNDQKNREGELLKNRVDFFRCKIDGSNNSRIYTTHSEHTSVKYNVARLNKDAKNFSTYLTILDGTELISFEFNKDENKGKRELAKDVTGAVWVENGDYVYNQNVSEFDKNVYFTQATTDTNKISKVDLVTKTVKTIVDDNTSSFTLKDCNGGKLYYERKQYGNTVFASNTLGDSFDASEQIIYNNSYSGYFVVGAKTGDYAGGVLAVNDNGTYFVKDGENGETNRITVASKKYNVLFSNGSKVYVRESSVQIFEIDLTDNSFKAKEILKSDIEGKNDASKYVDFDGRFITYLATNKVDETTTYYTHLVDLSNYDSVDGYLDVFAGKYAKGEQPKKEEKK